MEETHILKWNSIGWMWLFVWKCHVNIPSLSEMSDFNGYFVSCEDYNHHTKNIRLDSSLMMTERKGFFFVFVKRFANGKYISHIGASLSNDRRLWSSTKKHSILPSTESQWITAIFYSLPLSARWKLAYPWLAESVYK